VCLATPDSFEGDESAADASFLLPGTPQHHTFDRPGDQDWVNVQVTHGETYRFRTTDLGVNTDTTLELYASDGVTLLLSNDDSDGMLASTIDWHAPRTERIYLRVRNWNPGSGGCGTAYRLTRGDDRVYLPLIRCTEQSTSLTSGRSVTPIPARSSRRAPLHRH
jgi:hypothetical protein